MVRKCSFPDIILYRDKGFKSLNRPFFEKKTLKLTERSNELLMRFNRLVAAALRDLPDF